MTKAEIISEIMYELRFVGHAEFTADDRPYNIERQGAHWHIIGLDDVLICANSTEVRNHIRMLGKDIVQM